MKIDLFGGRVILGRLGHPFPYKDRPHFYRPVDLHRHGWAWRRYYALWGRILHKRQP